MTQIDDLVKRARWLSKGSRAASDAKHYADLADALEAQAAREKKLEKVIAWANNSLFGSHSFFLSVNGSKDNEHHLDEAIEKLKEQTGSDYARIASLEAQLESFMEAATPSAETKAAYIGEFSFQVHDGYGDEGEELYRKVTVPWTTVKEIMKAISARALMSALKTETKDGVE